METVIQKRLILKLAPRFIVVSALIFTSNLGIAMDEDMESTSSSSSVPMTDNLGPRSDNNDEPPISIIPKMPTPPSIVFPSKPAEEEPIKPSFGCCFSVFCVCFENWEDVLECFCCMFKILGDD